jgi:phosphoglycolate phosphatase
MRPLIAFDLDGTLIDSKRDLAESANELLATYGAAPLAESEVASMVGDGARQLVQRALDASGVTADVAVALDRFLTIYSGRLFVHTRPYPSLTDAVAIAARHASLAVVTNKPEKLSRRLLDGFALSGCFRWVIGGDSGFPRKPDPAGLSHVIGEASVAASRCLMIGDSMVDVEAARGAGTRVCVAQYGFGHLRRPMELNGTELIAHRPQDVLTAIETFLNAWRPQTHGVDSS